MEKFLPLILVLLFLIGILILFSFLPQNQVSKTQFQKEVTKRSDLVEKKKELRQKDFTKLMTAYHQILASTQAEFVITFLDLNSREKVSVDGEKTFHAASTTKPIVAAYILKLIDEGKITFDQNIEGIPLSERLRLMINISDNDSWETLLDFFGFGEIQKFTQSLNLTNTNHFENSTTSDDLAKFLVQIYQGEILSNQSQNFLLKLMQNTETEDRIPAGIPDQKLVFHKSGSWDGEIHDIAIILHPEHPFVLTIMSRGENDLDKRPQILAEIAKASWYFANTY